MLNVNFSKPGAKRTCISIVFILCYISAPETLKKALPKLIDGQKLKKDGPRLKFGIGN